MTVTVRISFRAKDQDAIAIQKLSEYLERSVSDTVRFVARKTAREYGLLPAKNEPVEPPTRSEDPASE